MHERLLTSANEAYAKHFQVEVPAEPERMGFDGWLVVVRAFTVLIAGLLVISVITVI